MRLGLATGTPLIDGLWIGAVVANIEGAVLAVEMGADPLASDSWRTFSRDDVMTSRGGLAYAVHNETDRERIIASWHRPCGCVHACAVKSDNVTLDRRHPGIATPRALMAPATAR